jgi:hypothetical protein
MDVKKLIALILVCLSLTGCSKWQEHSFKGKAEDYLREHLRDPSSAQFQKEKVVWRKEKELILCGQLNAKNGMGGMTGFTPFLVIGQIDGMATKDYDGAVMNPAPISDDDKAQAAAFVTVYENNCGKMDF